MPTSIVATSATYAPAMADKIDGDILYATGGDARFNQLAFNLREINKTFRAELQVPSFDVVALKAGGSTYPTVLGTNGQVLTTNGAGALSWTTVGGGGGGYTTIQNAGTSVTQQTTINLPAPGEIVATDFASKTELTLASILGVHTLRNTSGGVGAEVSAVSLSVRPSGTATAGVGAAIAFDAKNGAGNQVQIATIGAVTTVVSDTAESAYLHFDVIDGGSILQAAKLDGVGFKTLSGVAAAPGISFLGFTGQGMFPATNKLGFSVGASEVLALQGLATSGSPTPLLFTGQAHTTLASGTEYHEVRFNLGQTKQLTGGGGPIATMRAMRVDAPTYAFTSATTITAAYTTYISGPPVAGTNATLTNAYALGLVGNSHLKSTSAAAAAEYTVIIDKDVAAAASNKLIDIRRQNSSILYFEADASDVINISVASNKSFRFQVGGTTAVTLGPTALTMSSGVVITAGTINSIQVFTPSSTDARDLGTTSLSWRDLFCRNHKGSGSGNVSQIEVGNSTDLFIKFYTNAVERVRIINDGLQLTSSRLYTNKGANVAIAQPLTLGTDGNVFEITGSGTTINGIVTTGWQAGSIVVLHFSSATSNTVTHNSGTPGSGAVAIKLATSANFLSGVSGFSTLTLVYNGTFWLEISRQIG